MPGKVLSIVNMKGGVGKTTLTVCISEALAVMAKRRVLVIDLDSQASCTYALAGRGGMSAIRFQHKHAYYVFSRLLAQIGAVEPVPAVAPMLPTADPPGTNIPPINPAEHLHSLLWKDASALTERKELDLLGSAPELQKLERDILFELGRREPGLESPERRIAEHFRPYLQAARQRYAWTIVDCPPGISAFTAAAIRESDIILAPGMPDFLSLLGLQVFAQTVLRPIQKKIARHTESRSTNSYSFRIPRDV